MSCLWRAVSSEGIIIIRMAKNNLKQKSLEGSRGGLSPLLSWVNMEEQYGPHIVEAMVKSIHPSSQITRVCDIGVGKGRDLGIVQKRYPQAKLFGIDFLSTNASLLKDLGIEFQSLNVERDEFPYSPESIDLFIANQIYEHLKEIFWVSHQIAKTLRIGGYYIIGAPNICAFHNRVLFNFGAQPSQMKSYSAHVRGFSPKEIPRFFELCFPGGFEIVKFAGAQFYPFPKFIARILCFLFPSFAHSVFFSSAKEN